MHNLRSWGIKHLQPRLPDPVTKVEVLSIHEKVLIEIPNNIEYASPHHHARTAEGIDFSLCILIQVGEVIAPENTARRKKAAQAEYLRQSHERSRIAATRSKLQRAVCVKYLAPYCPAIWMLPKEIDQCRKRILLHKRIRVDKKHVIPNGLPQSLVAGTRKP